MEKLMALLLPLHLKIKILEVKITIYREQFQGLAMQILLPPKNSMVLKIIVVAGISVAD